MQETDIKKWIENGPDVNLVKEAENFGKELKNGNLTRSQIRQSFTKMKSIEAKGFSNNKSNFLMLKPFLAYAAGRDNKDGIKKFKEKISIAIDYVFNGPTEKEEERFKNFCMLFEAILSYHRAHGGN